MIAVDLQRFRARVDAISAVYARRNAVSNANREWVAEVLGEHVKYDEDRSCAQLTRLKQLIDNEAALEAVAKRLTT